MRPSTRFALDPLPAKPDEDARSRLIDAGRVTALVLPGCCLEAQYERDDGALLFATHDVPFEEGLEICLIGPGDARLDRVSVFWPYATGTLRDLAVRSSRSVEFRFLGDALWTVEVLPASRFRLPFLSGPTGVWRSFGFRTCLRLKAMP